VKACQVCGYVCNDVAPTCPNCGEASWAAMVRAEKRPEPVAAPVAAPAPAERFESRRNDDRRGRR
jgi:predicted ATP-dependent serine protease